MTTRRSLKDRDQDAITAAEAPDAEPAKKVAQDPEPKKATPQPKKARTKTKTGSTPNVRIGIYFHADDFTAAKAAYLADWNAGGQADTFAKWIAGALDAHAARTPNSRAKNTRPAHEQAGRGLTRSFDLPADTTERMKAALVADQQAERWVSMSDWCGDAVHAAVEAAREVSGGALPTPPARLPNRLIR
ncbi:MAG: hypothetical protein WA880_16650 [Ornithinimicrobium sp.]